MNTITRSFLSFVIWWLAVFCFIMSIANEPGRFIGIWEVLAFFALFILPSIIATIMIWRHAPQQQSHHVTSAHKRKRTDLDAIVALMDEQQRETLRQSLNNNPPYKHKPTDHNHLTDGELPFDAEEYDYNRS